MNNLSKYEKGGIIAFVILALCVGWAFYQNDRQDQANHRQGQKIEANRYENCLAANKAISQLNLQNSIQKQTLSLATEVAKQKVARGDQDAARRVIKYEELNSKLHSSVELECVKPKH